MKSKKNVLFVLLSMGSGGAEHAILNLFHMMKDSSYNIDFLVMSESGELLGQVPDTVNLLKSSSALRFCTAGDLGKLLRNSSVKRLALFARYFIYSKLKTFENRNHREQTKWRMVYKPLLKKLDKKYDLAIAFMHMCPSYFVVDFVQAERKILWIRNDFNTLFLQGGTDERYYDKADKIITISQACREAFLKFYPQFEQKITFLLNLHIKEEIFKKAEEFFPTEYQKAKSDCGEDVKILVSVGRLLPQKGFELSIEACRFLKERGLVFKWFVLGEGDLHSELEAAAAAAGVDDLIHFVGVRKNPYPYIKNADLLVQSSRWEGKSLVLDEAKMLCKPIVATNYNTVSDQLENGVNGRIVDMDGQALAEGILALLADKEAYERIIDNLENTEDVYRAEYEKYLKCFEGDV